MEQLVFNLDETQRWNNEEVYHCPTCKRLKNWLLRQLYTSELNYYSECRDCLWDRNHYGQPKPAYQRPKGIPSWPMYKNVGKRLADAYAEYYWADLENVDTGHKFESRELKTKDQMEFENKIIELMLADKITRAVAYDLIDKAHSGYQQRAHYWLQVAVPLLRSK